MIKKALILTGNFVQDHEFIYPYYRVQEDGYEVDVAVGTKSKLTVSLGLKLYQLKIFLN